MSNPALLILRLEGPLQSWGLRARWDVRDSGSEPSKSGLIGLLGCALGLNELDLQLEEMDKMLQLGVRTENPGRPLVDFHTITGALERADGKSKGSEDKPATILSPRTYLQDAAFLAIFNGPEALLVKCRSALLNPRWTIYLGRKSCPPSRPVLEELSYDYSSLEEALQKYPWDWDGKCVLRNNYPEKLYCVLEDIQGTAIRPDRIRINPARMYDSRQVRMFFIDFPGEKEDVLCTSHA